MGTLPPTPTLGLVLPDPGTMQQFSTATQNGWFQTIDTAIDADRDRLVAIEPRVLAAGATPGIVPAGTTAQRDAFWGIPGAGAPNMAARIALANKGARWFNTEKGFEQQYFAATADTPATVYSRTTEGWFASISQGREVPIRPATVTNVGGSFIRNGGAIEFTGVTTISFDSCFNDADFRSYKLMIEMSPASASTPTMRLRTGATDYTGAGLYGYNSVQTIGAAAGSGGSGSEDKWYLVGANVAATAGASTEITLHRPAWVGTIPRLMTGVGTGYTGSAGITSVVGGFTVGTTARDGFTLFPASGGVWTGRIAIYGLNDY